MVDFKEKLWILFKLVAVTLLVMMVLYTFWPQLLNLIIVNVNMLLTVPGFVLLYLFTTLFISAIVILREKPVRPKRLHAKTPRAGPMGYKPPQSSEPQKSIIGDKQAEIPKTEGGLNRLEDVEEFGSRTLEQAKMMLEQPPTETLEPATLEQDKALEKERILTLEQDEKLEQREMLKPPTKEELQRLKEVLELGKGSLSYKKRGEGVYHVIYNSDTRKHKWTRIGSWPEIQAKLTE